jgi:ppGpp synthetase/RelA/SpoT-type nucleotidyltranferase
MIVPHLVQKQFEETRPYVQELGERVHATVYKFCDEHQFAYLKRLKTLQSIAEKLESGRFKDWSSLDDLFACTIVIPTLTDEPVALQFLRDTFDIVGEKLRGQTQKSPEVFRFDSARFIGRLKPPSPDLATEKLYTVPFEVQIKTAFEHAWSSATHKLVYKSQELSWKRMRLAAQIKASVEQLDLLIQAFDQHSQFVTRSPWRDVDQKAEILQAFISLKNQKKLPTEVMPKDLSRFTDNVFSLLQAELSRRHRQKIRTTSAPRDTMEIVIEQAANFVSTTPLSSEDFPRQLSLFQYTFGILSEEGIIAPPLKDYYAVITPELVERYPSTKLFAPKFAF